MKKLILIAASIALVSCASSPNLFSTPIKAIATPTEAELFDATALGNKICPIDGKEITASSHYVHVIVNDKSFRLCSKEDVEFFKASPERYLEVAFTEVEKRKIFMKTKSVGGGKGHRHIKRRR